MNRPGAALEAGIRALMRGDRAEAERCWRAALAVDPADERAREYLTALTASPPAGGRAAGAPAPAAALAAASAWDEQPAGATVALPLHGGVDLDVVLCAEGPPAPVIPAPEPPAEPEDAAAAAARDAAAWMQGARELFALGDFTGSLELVERVLAADPEAAEALAYLRENETTLVAMYESKLGPLDGTPRVRVRPEEVLWLNLDHRAGFVLSQIDGTMTWEDLFALSGMARLDTARILARLVEDGVVSAG